jgi:hypothetical protein
MRFIKLTEEFKEKCVAQFLRELEGTRFASQSSRFTFDISNHIPESTDKIIINMNPEVYLKMWSLVDSEQGEIGWHGTVKRHDTRLFEITDILVYPQIVSGITVETDDLDYANWLHKELSDEQINTLRFHGHSHVNMSPSPSGVDTTWYNTILQGLFEDDYYIFMILNKKREFFIEVYDLKTNTIYEKQDIQINVMLQNKNYLKNWTTQNKERYLQPKKPVQQNITPANPRMAEWQNRAKEQAELRQFILNIGKAELEDKGFVVEVSRILQREAVWTNYFGIGWSDWHEQSSKEQIEVAQNYYLGIYDRKKKKGKTKPAQYNWRKELYEDD